MIVWSSIVGFLIVGYFCTQKAFAYLGVPPLFVGEAVLAMFLFLKPRVALGTWAASLLRQSPLNAFGLALLAFVSYGAWQAARGVIGGAPFFYTMKFFIFNYYPLYLFLGIWVGLQTPDFLPKLVRVVAWVHGIYGLLWITVLGHAPVYLPGQEWSIFGWPGGAPAAILGVLCFARNLRAVWPVLALNLAVTLFVQQRAQWLGLAAGALVWAFLARRLGQAGTMAVAALAVLGTIELAGFQLSGDRGAISLGSTLAQALAPIDAELARKFSPDSERHSVTATWRERWWEQIWLSVHSTPKLEAFGHGYGFDLFALAPEDVRAGQSAEVRTPHSVFFYALGYTGWVGVAIFTVFQMTILSLLWRSFRLTGQPVGVVWWAMGIAMAFFEASFDTPYKAIPFYLLIGLSIAPGLQLTGERYARVARAQLLPTAGR
jgi:hypothetical protein